MTSSFTAPLRALFLGLGLLAAATPIHAKTRYVHASAGNIDVVSSITEERTLRFLHELVGLRLLIEDLLDTPVTQPATQVIIFRTQKEMDEFFPSENQYWVRYDRKWHTTTSPEGELFVTVDDWPNDKILRHGAMRLYATRLISRALPKCPFWIYEGLATFLCTVEYRNGTLRLGEDRIERRDVLFKHADRLPLAETLGKNWNSKDISGLWHLWLTQDYAGNRAKIRELARLIRQGAPGNAETVSQAFGLSVAELQEMLYKHMRRVREVTVDIPAPTTGSLGRLAFQPAADLDVAIARNLIALTLDQRPPGLRAALDSLKAAHPDSPRPRELLARLATLEGDTATAIEHWLEACARQTGNPFGYLVPLRQALEPRIGQINLSPALPPERTAELRRYADVAMTLNPGNSEGFQWSAWIEALAPEPQPERVDRIEATHARYLHPGTFLPLAISNIRLKRYEHANRLLDEYETLLGAANPNKPAIEFLRKRIPAAG